MENFTFTIRHRSWFVLYFFHPFFPPISSLSTHVGGIIYPIIFSSLRPKLGFPWATRVLGFVTLGELIIAMAVSYPTPRARLP